jgi:hypothetical protein
MKSIELKLYGMNFRSVNIVWDGIYVIEAISDITSSIIIGTGNTLDDCFKSFLKEFKRQNNIKFLNR